MGKKTWKSTRPIRIDGAVALIKLTQGKFAVVDAADAHLVEDWNWHAVKSGRTWYAWRGDGSHFREKLHNAIAGPGLMDHRDGDGLNNRRSNLRPATLKQNAMNRRCFNKHGLKGVCLTKSGWRASIWCKKQTHLGFYQTKEMAALAYDAKARELFGEFANLNFK